MKRSVRILTPILNETPARVGRIPRYALEVGTKNAPGGKGKGEGKCTLFEKDEYKWSFYYSNSAVRLVK